jgi:cell division protein FtsI (penicillin-binding protein 3)
MRSTDVRVSTRRVAVVRALLVLVFVALAARATHLSVFDRRAAERGDAQSLRTLTLAPERGHIVDRSGADLALSVDAPSIYVIPEHLADASATARALAPILGLSRAPLEKKLRDRKGFLFLSRWVTDDRAERVRALALEGVGVLEEPRRVYPHRGLAARVLGFANIDGRGVRGLEQQEDDWLRGTTRRLPVERDGSGKLILKSGNTWGTAGGDVALTLDATVQAEAEQALGDAITGSGARGGVIVSMDPHTGEILALAESPTYDPNAFRTLDYGSTGSVAFLDAVEPGSALKPFVVAAALETGTLDPAATFDCEQGKFRIPGKTIQDTKPHGVLDLGGILRVSSNVCTVKIAQALGRSAQYEMLRQFGFGTSTESHFPDESNGVLRHWKGWTPVDQATIAFGQGISVTAVQLAAATSAIANGGSLVRPRLVWGRRAARGPWQPTRPEVVRRVVSRDTSERVIGMLETVVGPEGTGSRAGLAGVRVAGKTGTAQKFDVESGRYSQKRFRSWFVGMAPADGPQLVVVVGLDEPRRPHHTGGMSAAPLFARVATSHLAALGIHTHPQRAIAIASGAPATEAGSEPVQVAAVSSPPPAPVATRPAPRPLSKPAAAKPAAVKAAPARSARDELPPLMVALGGRVLLPDLRGLRVRDVTRITESSDLRVNVSGDGRAIRQDPPPGTVVQPGDVIEVFFSSNASSR